MKFNFFFFVSGIFRDDEVRLFSNGRGLSFLILLISRNNPIKNQKLNDLVTLNL